MNGGATLSKDETRAWRIPYFVVTEETPLLKNEVLHSALSGAELHDPKTHTHVEADVTDLSHDPIAHGPDKHIDQVRKLWIPARLWEAGVIVGAARGTIVDTPVWVLPDGNAEQIVAFMRTPIGAEVGTIALRLYLGTDVNAIAAGICQMVSEMTPYNEGDPITAAGGGISQDIEIRNSGAGISLLEISQELLYSPFVGGLNYCALMLTRRGDLGGDTYTGTVNFIAVEVQFTFES